MEDCLIKTTQKRRSIYALNKNMPFDDTALEAHISAVLKDMPSAFNGQSARLVLLLGEAHQKLWAIVLNALKSIVPAQNLASTEKKIAAFAAAYGTILFFEDVQSTTDLQQKFPTYAEHFQAWAEQGNGMLQFGLWAMFAENNIGASLQHYNPLIDDDVHQTWDIPSSWRLIAQMPFGGIEAPAAAKTYLPVAERLKIFQ